MIPKPFGVDVFGRQLALNPDAAVAGLLPEIAFTPGIGRIGFTGFVGFLPAGNFVDQDTAVNAYAIGAPEGFRLETANPADHEEFPGGSFMEKVGFVLCETGGAQQGAEELSLFEDIEPLLKLINDQAVGLVHFLCFEAAGFDPALEVLSKDLHGGAFLGRGIGFNQGPVSFLLQDVNTLAGAGDHTHIVSAFLIRLGEDTYLFPLFAGKHCYRLGEHLPDGFLIHTAHFQIPEAQFMVTFDSAELIGRMVEDIRGEKGILHVCELFPFLFHFFCLFSEGQEGKEEQENQQQGQEFF